MSFLIVASLPLGLHTYLLPLATLALDTCFLPFGFGNSYVRRLISGLKPADAPPTTWAVQLTFSPRSCSGPRALLDDADDFGFLCVRDSGLEYYGDSVRFTLPASQIATVRLAGGGLRGMFIPGTRIRLTLNGAVTGLQPPSPQSPAQSAEKPPELVFAERSTLLLPHSRRTTAALFQALSKTHAGAARG